MRNKILTAGVVLAVLVTTTCASFATDDATKKKTVTSQKYVDDIAATKQTKLSAQGGDYAVIYPNSENNEADGAVTARPIINYIDDADFEGELITAGAVKTALDSKQNLIDGNSTLNGKVITYTGTVGQTGTRDVYNDSNSYSGQTGALVAAEHVNAGIANGFNAHLTCNAWEGNYTAQTDPTGEHCLTYSVNTLSGTYMPENQ